MSGRLGSWKTAVAVGCAIVFLSGCWDSRDIDNRMLVGAMGMELGNSGTVQVWLRFPLPKTSMQPNKKEFFTVSQRGQTVQDALDKVGYMLPKALDPSSTRALLLDEALAKSGIEPYLEFAIRERSVPLDTVVAIVRGDMRKIFTSPTPTGELSGIYTKLFFEPYAGGIPRKNKAMLWDIYSKLYNPLHANLIPIVAQSKQNSFSLYGNAIFLGDKMVGVLNRDESLLYEIFTHRFHDSEVELMNRSDIRIVHNEAKVRTSLKGGVPVIDIDCTLITTLIDSARMRKLSADQIVASLERNLMEHTRTMFEKTQAKGADVFGFGDQFRSRLKASQYEKWPELFKSAQISYRFHVDLRNTGLQFLD